MTLIGAFGIIAIFVLLVFGSRRVASLALVAGALYITEGQAINVGGFNIFSIRIFEIAAVCRILCRGELSFRTLTPVDKLLAALYIYTAAVYSFSQFRGTG